MTDTTHLVLPFIDAAQAQKHVTHNEALQLIDALVHLSVVARNQTAPPASPAEGDRYLVGAGATGAFAGKDLQVAAWLAGAWIFLAPRAGWLAHVAAEQLLLVHDGATWRDAGLALRELQSLVLLGVGATADAGNPLSAKLNAALFAAKTAAEGGSGDLRVKLEKEAVGNVVSQLYQTDWSGRAETGLIGDDNFHVKVSADGAAWKEAINIDKSTGAVAFPSGVGDGSLAAFRNRLRNASFSINQRGVSGTATLSAGAYGHDGVKAGAGGATYTFSTSGLDTTLTITSGSLILPIEDLSIEGGTYVLSHAGTAQARVWQTSASGSYATVPATGLVVTGLAANTLTAIEFSTGTVLRPQFEPGAYRTSFERRPAKIEMALCQRYYRRYPGAVSVPMCNVSVSGSSLIGVIDLGIDMRAAPTTSASFADADFSSGAAPNSSQWAVGAAGASWSTKSGTATISIYTTKDRLILRTLGATYSGVPNIFTMGGAHYIEASAEL